MSIMDKVWNGGDIEVDAHMPFDVADWEYHNENEYSQAPLRWNKNMSPNRKRNCWVCGEITSDYYAHKWRTKDGKVENIKCTCCFNEYKGIKNEK